MTHELPPLRPKMPLPPPPLPPRPGMTERVGGPLIPPPPPPMTPSVPGIRIEAPTDAIVGEEVFSIPKPTRPEAASMEELVLEAKRLGASDIHLGVGEIPRFRVRGRMLYSDYIPTTIPAYYRWWQELLPAEQLHQFEKTKELDTAIMYPGMARLRVNMFFTLLGPAAVLRLINLEIPTMEDLNLPESLKKIAEAHKGLVLITGPTGSGKSTTLAAMIRYINENFAKHIISIEDPIEYVHTSIRSMVRQREVGSHTLEFEAALRASLREDPDIILIGEMRDRVTVDTALKAAQTGHLVFGTLHTNSAVSTIERLLNIYTPAEQNTMRSQIAESLVAVIAQALVRTTDKKRAAIHEIMVNTDAAKDYIKGNKVDELDQLIPLGGFDGMQTMNQVLYKLVQEGRVDEETASEASPRPNEFKQLLRGKMDNTRMV